MGPGNKHKLETSGYPIATGRSRATIKFCLAAAVEPRDEAVHAD